MLTVVIPTIGRPTLGRAMQSVRAQTVPTSLVVHYDVDRQGCGATINRAMERVTTPWVGFLADDDRLDPHYHEWFLDEREDADLFIFTMQYAFHGGCLPVTLDPAQLVYGQVGGSFIMRTELARRLPFPQTKDAEDWAMIEAVRDAGYKIKISPRVGYVVRP